MNDCLDFFVDGRNWLDFRMGIDLLKTDKRGPGLKTQSALTELANFFIRCKRTKEVRRSNRTEVVFLLKFIGNASPHNRQALTKTLQRIGRYPSYIISK